jgi:hypothetical protein
VQLAAVKFDATFRKGGEISIFVFIPLTGLCTNIIQSNAAMALCMHVPQFIDIMHINYYGGEKEKNYFHI